MGFYKIDFAFSGAMLSFTSMSAKINKCNIDLIILNIRILEMK
jgi:hypothetical protein